MLAPQSERLDGDSPLLGLAVAARDYYPGWVRELEAASGVDVGLCASGGFLAPAMDGDVVHRWRPPAAGGTSLWLDRPAAAAMEPLLAPEAVGGWWFPQDMSVDPRAVHKALLSACAAAGVMVREGSAAVALELAPHGGSVRAVRLTDGTVMPTPGPLVIANEVAGGEDRGEQPYYDPDSDVRASIRWAMRANKDFIAQLEQGIEPKYGQARPDAAGAAPGGSSAGAASGSVVEEAQEALPTSLPGMVDGARLWIVREGEPLPVPIFEGSPPQEFLAGYGDTMFKRPVNGVPVNGVAAPVHGADAVASAPTAVATASAPEAKRWALPTMTPPPNAPPPPASDDAIHSTDGYAELTSQDQSHATRDAVIKSARAANKRFREMVLEENDDSALQALIEADLAKYRRGESPNV
ncbi:glycine oxidase [Chrysochromulina tobinii]|uniref:Glycine oxidase n=1 Tax=Chrysochromulina tobinii TaxID=1460289 RepID=A0A0M0JWU7_9EUKA|nr:glycine oxidase [Chrysochromulina tobinii]|eukprot:KOO31024.1 glycine oxidase [Chrysochromulina sp. CCMP291]